MPSHTGSKYSGCQHQTLSRSSSALKASHRSAYSRGIQAETAHVCFMLSSNQAEATPDLANRAIITRLRKQPASHQFKIYEEGDLLAHVQTRPDYYLSCVDPRCRRAGEASIRYEYSISPRTAKGGRANYGHLTTFPRGEKRAMHVILSFETLWLL